MSKGLAIKIGLVISVGVLLVGLAVTSVFVYQNRLLGQAQLKSEVVKGAPRIMFSLATNKWVPPRLEILSPRIAMKYTRLDIWFGSDRPLEVVAMPAGWKFQPAGIANEKYIYVIETKEIPTGQHKYELILSDEDYGEVSFAINLDAPPGRPTAPFWPNSKYISNPNDLTAMVNKKFRLASYYEPSDLVALSAHGIRSNGGSVRSIIIDDLKEMIAEIDQAGINYLAGSAYRSFETQVATYNYWLDRSRGNVDYTDSFSARPGHSEHQLGTTIDFATQENRNTFEAFDRTQLGIWLSQNAYKYGFLMSYPKNKTEVTGYTFEPWHYRYVGKDIAKLVTESGLTLTEWLEIYYPQ